jgi:adenylate cyclase
MRSSRPSSIRWSLLRSFVTIVLLSSLTVLVFMSLRARETERQLSAKLIGSGSRQVERAIDGFVHPALEATAVGSRWGRAGLLPLDGAVDSEPGQASASQLARVRQLADLLLPILQSQEELSSAQIANERGEGLMLLQTEKGCWVRVVNRPRWGTQTLWVELDAEGQALRHEWRVVDYDPTERPWFSGILGQQPGAVFWTAAYLFFTTGDLGITASSAWSDDGVQHVIAWDVLLSAVTTYTQQISSEVSSRALVVVMAPDGRVIGLPRVPAYRDESAIRAHFLRPLSELDSPVVWAFAAAASGHELPAYFTFESDGDTWWAGLRDYRMSTNHRLHLAVLIPDSDLLEEVAHQRQILLGATALALLAALAYSLLLARSYSRPLEALAAQSEKIRHLDFREDEQIEARLVEFQVLANAQRQALRALQSFSRYVPLEVVSELVETDQVARIGGREASLTVMFSDIAGFTSIAESMTPEALAQHLSRYFEGVVYDVQQHGGTVDKLIGDAVMAFWGAPRPMPDHCRRAVLAVASARRVVAELNRQFAAEGRPGLPTRFGLATGRVIVGNMGATNRLAYTVIGDTVNLASRLEGLNKLYGSTVMAEQAVVDAGGEGFNWRRLDRVRVVGRSGPVWVYELLETAADEVVAAYEAAWDRYAAGDFETAARALEAILAEGEDPPSRALLERCRTLAAEPLPPGWDGIRNLQSK